MKDQAITQVFSPGRSKSQYPHANLMIPVSFYQSVKDSGEFGFCLDINQEIPWPLFGYILEWYSQQEFLFKISAPLFVPTVMRGTRSVLGATTSALLTGDADGCGVTIDQVTAVLEGAGLEAIVYTSSSNLIGDRFRVIVPLAEAVDTSTQARAMAALRDFLRERLGQSFDFDDGKMNAYSMFYVPGKTLYPEITVEKEDGTKVKVACAKHRFDPPPEERSHFFHVSGGVLSAADWLDLYPRPIPEPVIYQPGDPAERPIYSADGEAEIVTLFESLIIPTGSRESRQGWHEGIMCRGCGKKKGAFLSHSDGWQYKCWIPSCMWSGHGTGWSNERPLGLREKELYSQFGGHPDDLPKRQLSEKELAWINSDWVHDQAEHFYESMRLEALEDQQLLQGDYMSDEELHDEPILDNAPVAETDDGDADDGQIHNFFGSLVPEPVLTQDMLPTRIGPFVWDESERMGSDLAALALPCIIATSAAITDDMKIAPFEKNSRFQVSARLWGLVSGPPGSNKSGAMEAAMAPLEKVAAQWGEEDDAAFEEYEAAMEEYEEAKRKTRNRGKDDDGDVYEPVKPEKPIRRALITNEFTMEGLSPTLADNPRGMLCYADEILEILAGFDAYKSNGAKKDGAAALALFDRRPRRVTRAKTLDRPVYVPNWGAQQLGGIQPDKLAEKAKHFSSDGMLQRFEIVTVGLAGEGIDRYPNLDVVADYEMMIERLCNFNPVDPPVVTLSPEAHVYRKRVEKLARAIITAPAVIPALQGHAAKLKGIFPRLLLTFHMAEVWPLMVEKVAEPVSGETARRAYLFMTKFLLPHVVKVYETYFRTQSIEYEIVQGVAELILTHGLTTLTDRDIQRNGPHQIRKDKRKRDAVIEVLRETNWLVREVDNNCRNKKTQAGTKWLVNPRVHIEYAAQAERIRRQRELNKRLFAASRDVLDAEYGDDDEA